MALNIAIIGSGMAGLTLAKQLGPRANITLFEKSRGLGGRMATRYAHDFDFDHGAQFFVAKTEAFRQFLSPLVDAGVIAPWLARFAEFNGSECHRVVEWEAEYPHYVGVPGMNAIGKYLGQDETIYLNTTIESIHRVNEQWMLVTNDKNSHGPFDWVISTAPVAQSIQLMPLSFCHQETMQSIKMQACFSLMLGFDTPQILPFDAALIKQADISWVSVMHTKPGRPSTYGLLVHATNRWADCNFERNDADITEHLRSEVARVLRIDTGNASHVALHKWRYANCKKHTLAAPLIDVQNQLAVCGDWCIQGNIEAAFTSAYDLSATLLSHINK